MHPAEFRSQAARGAWVSLVLVCLASRARAQDTRFLVREGGGDQFGASLAAAGDWNGDGIGDLVVGAPRPWGGQPGYAAVLSGANGDVLRVLAGSEGDDHFGISVAGGEDLDGDGVAEVVVGAVSWKGQARGIAGIVRIFSGADGHLLRALAQPAGAEMFGRELLLLDDVDGDGKGDVLVGCPALDGSLDGAAGKVIACSGATGAILYESVGEDRRDRFAQSLARAGDLDGDSIPDVLIGAPGFAKEERDSGYVRAISGRTGSTLFTLALGPRHSGFGYALAGERDWNGDGILDLAVGTRAADRTAWGLRILSGADRAVLESFEPDCEIHRPGEALILIGAPQACGGARLVVADRFSSPPAIRIRTAGGAWSTVTDVPDPARAGLRLCALADVDGDGSDDFAASCDWATPPGDPHGPSIGEVRVYSGATGIRLYGVPGGIGP